MDSYGVHLPRILLEFFLNLYIHHGCRKVSNLWIRLLANKFVQQKIKFVHFYSRPQAKLSHKFLSLPHTKKEITCSSWTAFSEDLFFPKGGQTMIEMKKVPKLNLRGIWSQVLINSTILVTFTFLFFVLM